MYYNNKNKLKNAIAPLVLLGAMGISPLSQAGVISEILFTNETPIALSTSIAGLPGHGIEANVSQAVSFDKVSLGCFFGGNMQNCAINFTNRDNGELVATVYINADTATLTQAPVFHGDYANSYQVTGWETSPVSHITIQAKA